MNVECPDQACAECALVPLLQPQPLLEEQETEQQGRKMLWKSSGPEETQKSRRGWVQPGLGAGGGGWSKPQRGSTWERAPEEGFRVEKQWEPV